MNIAQSCTKEADGGGGGGTKDHTTTTTATLSSSHLASFASPDGRRRSSLTTSAEMAVKITETTRSSFSSPNAANAPTPTETTATESVVKSRTPQHQYYHRAAQQQHPSYSPYQQGFFPSHIRFQPQAFSPSHFSYQHQQQYQHQHQHFGNKSNQQLPPRSFVAHAAAAGDENESFTVMTYNILAPCNVDELLYEGIPEWIMQWPRRCRTILKELCQWQPDIICIQEAQNFEHDILCEMKKHGYDGVFKSRNTKHDGCALLYKTSTFRLLEYVPIEYCISESMDRDNIAQIFLFEDIRNKKKVLVSNTHLLFNPKRGDIKLGQLMMLLDAVSCAVSGFDPDGVIMCGDFNLCPNSPLYNLIAHGSLNITDLISAKMSLQLLTRGIKFGRLVTWFPEIPLIVAHCDGKVASHPLKLQSAYLQVEGREPPYTSIMTQGRSCVDYIWFRPVGLQVAGVWSVLPHRVVCPFPSLPTKQTPSDHVPLISRMQYTHHRK